MNKRFIAGGTAALLVSGGLVLGTATAALPHTPEVTADCDSVTLTLTSYPADGNTYTVIINGDENPLVVNFGSRADYTANLDPTVPNTWKFLVDSEGTEWDRVLEGSSDPDCIPEEPEPEIVLVNAQTPEVSRATGACVGEVWTTTPTTFTLTATPNGRWIDYGAGPVTVPLVHSEHTFGWTTAEGYFAVNPDVLPSGEGFTSRYENGVIYFTATNFAVEPQDCTPDVPPVDNPPVVTDPPAVPPTTDTPVADVPVTDEPAARVAAPAVTELAATGFQKNDAATLGIFGGAAAIAILAGAGAILYVRSRPEYRAE